MRSGRTTTAWLGAVATTATTALAFATPAHAATVTVTATCSPENVVVVDKSEITATVGDTLFLVNLTGVTVNLENKVGIAGANSLGGVPPQGANLTVTAATGSFDIVATSGPCNGTGAGVTFGPASSSSAPPSVTQQFGRPSTGTCDAAAPASLNWAGVASGGWGESYAEWMNNGTGGFVCTRTLVYSDNLGAWTVS